ncbi:MAG TPA: hypothetical protein VFU02_20225 [Polyangiaceae bacterium]|nr:hypothetical protein [Polyangiaceae bacterium]
MARRIVTDDPLGFDLDGARDAVIARLVQDGYVSHLECEVVRRASDDRGSEEEVRWAAAIEIAYIHGSTHYEIPPEEDERSRKCLQSPCRGAGLSFALFELADYWNALSSGGVSLMKHVATVSAELNSIDLRLRSQSLPAAELLSCNREGVEPTPADVALQWLSDLHQLRERAPAIVASLSHALLIDHLPKLRKRRKGRNAQELLTVVWQQLANGGFSFREIAELIPDLTPGDTDAMMERIRKRVALPQAHGVTPCYYQKPHS